MWVCVCVSEYMNMVKFHKRWEECNFYWFFFHSYLILNISIPQPQKKGHKIHNNNNWFIYIYIIIYLFIQNVAVSRIGAFSECFLERIKVKLHIKISDLLLELWIEMKNCVQWNLFVFLVFVINIIRIDTNNTIRLNWFNYDDGDYGVILYYINCIF